MIKNSVKFLLVVSVLFLIGCAYNVPEPFVPYTTYTTPPLSQKVSLQCLDYSNIYVITTEDNSWWYGGPERGWIAAGGGWYLLPYQVWPEKVFWQAPAWQRKYLNSSIPSVY